MIILGIDPGLATVGYGVIRVDNAPEVIDYGVITTPKEETLPVRLAMIEEDMNELLQKFSPDETAIEELFFNKNVTNAMAVAHARGVILLTLIKSMGRVFEYTPLQIKQGLTGYGRAEKIQVQSMVKNILHLKAVPKPDDAADALAVALCHSQTKNFSGFFSI